MQPLRPNNTFNSFDFTANIPVVNLSTTTTTTTTTTTSAIQVENQNQNLNISIDVTLGQETPQVQRTEGKRKRIYSSKNPQSKEVQQQSDVTDQTTLEQKVIEMRKRVEILIAQYSIIFPGTSIEIKKIHIDPSLPETEKQALLADYYIKEIPKIFTQMVADMRQQRSLYNHLRQSY